MTSSRFIAILLTFLLVLIVAGVALYFAFDSVGLAIGPAIGIAGAVAAAVYVAGRKDA